MDTRELSLSSSAQCTEVRTALCMSKQIRDVHRWSAMQVERYSTLADGQKGAWAKTPRQSASVNFAFTLSSGVS